MYLIDKLTVKERYKRSINIIESLIRDSSENSKSINNLSCILEDLRLIIDLEKIANYIHEGICIYNNEGKVTYVNESFVKITGHSFEEISRKDFSGFEFLGNKHILDKKIIIEEKGIFNTIIQSLRTNKKILISSTAILDDYVNNMSGIIETYRDVTELENIEERLKKFKNEVDLLSKENLKNELLLNHIQRQQENHNFIAKSREMENVREMIHKVAEFDVTVVINGETGCGKEVIANEIYRNSKRNKQPFIKINCAAIPVNLLEAELFGYEKGAFTGANPNGKIGMFELADNGTLLLDEIGEMSIELQSKLLRAIQNKEIMRIGGTKAIKIDLRILASTHRDLLELVRLGKFREDLYYRLNVFPIYIPPLRLRKVDIEELVSHFINLFNLKYNKLVTISEAGMEIMKGYRWPGNVRELQNVIERLVIISEYDESVDSNQVKVLLGSDISEEVLLEEDMGLKEIQEYVEKKYIKRAMKLGGSTRKAAKILKIDQSTVVRKAQKYGIKIYDAE